MFFWVLQARVSEFQRAQIKEIVSKNRDKYGSISHFVRVAIIQKIREDTKHENDK